MHCITHYITSYLCLYYPPIRPLTSISNRLFDDNSCGLLQDSRTPDGYEKDLHISTADGRNFTCARSDQVRFNLPAFGETLAYKLQTCVWYFTFRSCGSRVMVFCIHVFVSAPSLFWSTRSATARTLPSSWDGRKIRRYSVLMSDVYLVTAQLCSPL